MRPYITRIASRVKELIEAAGARVIYTAPYSPDLNPIELMFGVYKSALRRHFRDPLDVKHFKALRSVTPQKARNFFRKSRVPVCEHFKDDDEEDDMVLTSVVTAVVMQNRRSRRRKRLLLAHLQGGNTVGANL